MNTDQLKSFIQVAENLNFARAAEILNITQSAVSRQIHSLEDELGTRLLHRTTRTVTLTPAGISFLEDAKNVVGRLEAASRKIQRHQSSNIQILTIGCTDESILDLLCKVLKSCRAQIPELYPFLKVIPHRSILGLFYQGEIDLLFGFQDDIPLKNDIIYQELFRIPLCCIVPDTHPYADRTELAKEELYLENMVVCNSYAVPFKAAEMQNRIAQHILPESTYICDNLQALLTLVRAGYGCSILPQMHFISSDIRIIPITGSEPLSYGIFYRKNAVSPLLKKFISIMTATSFQ
ncbi:LysR family transcriptional regulator [Clostridiaceae bacterium]|nr:LysR family transcriptional regulator [Clostridiaceae bacterium]RKI16788.1 LysR family transcriptional regulator [bacterium 1XD21-70]